MPCTICAMTKRAVRYLRVSDDPTGLAEAVGRQDEDTAALCEAKGYEVVDTYRDNDVSAAGAVKKERPEFNRMLADATEGKFDVIVSYSNSRLTRRPRELEDLIELHQATGIVFDTCVSGQDDLSTADGRMVARIKANVDAAEAERVGERTKRQKKMRAEQGKPLGQRFRTFGYERDWTVNEDEAKVVREVFERAAAGQSQNAITKDLQARGIKTPAGKAWTALQTSRMLRTPKYAGYQTFKGEIVGKSTVVKALVTEAEFQACQNLNNGASFNFRKHLLSGILICDLCKAAMTGFHDKANDTVRYRCDVRSGGCGKVSIKAVWVEGMVDRYMSWWVAREYETRKDDKPAEAENNSAKIDEIDQRIAALTEQMGTGDLDLADGIAALKVARAERAKAVKEDTNRVKVTMDYRHAIADYDALNDDAKRVEIRKVFRFIFVKPGRRVRYFDDSRISVLRVWDDKPMPGAAVNTVDYRDEVGEGTRIADPEERGFDPNIGF